MHILDRCNWGLDHGTKRDATNIRDPSAKKRPLLICVVGIITKFSWINMESAVSITYTTFSFTIGLTTIMYKVYR